MRVGAVHRRELNQSGGFTLNPAIPLRVNVVHRCAVNRREENSTSQTSGTQFLIGLIFFIRQ